MTIKEEAVKSTENKQKADLSQIAEYKQYKAEYENYKKQYEEKSKAYDSIAKEIDNIKEAKFKATVRNLNLSRDYRKALNTLTSIINYSAELSRAANAILKYKNLSAEVKACLKTAAEFLTNSVSNLNILKNEDFVKDLTYKKYINAIETIDTSTPVISQELSNLYSYELAQLNKKFPLELTYKGGSQGRGFYEIHNGREGEFYGGKEMLPDLLSSNVKIKDPYSLLSRSQLR